MTQSRVPTISAYAIVQRPLDDRFLIIEKVVRGSMMFDLPGGIRNIGEKLLQTVVRTVAEDAMIRLSPTNYIGFGYHIYDGVAGRVCNLRSTFCGTPEDAILVSDGMRAVAPVHWMNLPELVANTRRVLCQDSIRCLREYIGGIRLPLDRCGEVDDQ